MPAIETALTHLLGIEHPILLAPMGSAAGGRLAAAVTNAGGFGMIGSGYASAEAVRKELNEAGNTRVGIGFILWALEKNPAALDVALDAKPAAIMLSFGDPTPFTGRIREAGCKIICQVQTLAQAKEAVAAGADVIIAQGRDAGGHSGTTRGTWAWFPRWSMPSPRSLSWPLAVLRMGVAWRPRSHWARLAFRWAPASPPPANRCGTRR
jgi:nitronate monooxygenase